MMYYQVEFTQSSSIHQTQKLHLFDEQHQPVGYAAGEFRQYAMWFEGQLHFFLHELVVTHPEHRPSGLGTQLLKAVEEFACTKGACWIRGQMALKSTQYADDPTDERSISRFWRLNGYGTKREIYEEAIRFWKPLVNSKQAKNASTIQDGNDRSR